MKMCLLKHTELDKTQINLHISAGQDSNQPTYQCSLIRVFSISSIISPGLLITDALAKNLIRLHRCESDLIIN